MAWSTRSGNSPVGPGGVASGGSRGKSNGAGTNALAEGIGHQYGISLSSTGKPPKNTQAGKSSGAGSGDEAPTITRTAPPTVMPAGWSATPNPNATYDKTGRLLSDGTITDVPAPSLGQIVGSLFSGLAPGGLGLLNSSADLTNPNPDTNGAPTGGYLGRAIDGARGVQPGAADGYVGNRVAPNSNSRNDRPLDDTRLLDRASADATAALVGDPITGGGTEYSDVQLQDRRKPRPLDDIFTQLRVGEFA